VARLEDPSYAVRPLRRRDLRNLDVSASTHRDINRLKVLAKMLRNRKTSTAALTQERRDILKRLRGDLGLHELAELSGVDASFVKREIERES